MGSVLAMLSCGVLRAPSNEEEEHKCPRRRGSVVDAKAAMANVMRSMTDDRNRRLEEAIDRFNKGEKREAIWRYRVYRKLSSMVEMMGVITQSMNEEKEMRVHTARYEDFLLKAGMAVDQEIGAPERTRSEGEIPSLQDALLRRIHDMADERQTQSDEVLTSLPDDSLEDEDVMEELQKISAQPRPCAQQTNNTVAAWLRQQKLKNVSTPSTRTFSDVSHEVTRAPSSTAVAKSPQEMAKKVNETDDGMAISKKRRSPPALAQLVT